MRLYKAFFTVGGMTFISRILGFCRDILVALFLGAGPLADAFFIALKLPNFFRRITAEGAFSFAFIPLYAKTSEGEGRDAASKFAGDAFLTMLTVLLPFTLLMMALMPFVVQLIAPGFAVDDIRYIAAVDMARITFPYLACMSVTALIGGVLNAHNRFAPFAFMPVLFNLVLIGALLLSPSIDMSAAYMLSYGVLIAGIVQLIWMGFYLKRYGYVFTLGFGFLNAKIKRLFALMAPAALGAGVTQINLFIDIILASFLPVGAVSYLYYADRLNQLPLGIIGVAIGTALLPMLSRALTSTNQTESKNLFSNALSLSLFLAIPSAFALCIIAEPIIHVLFERGSFDATATAMTAQALKAYAIGLPAYVMVKVLNTVYFSHEDTKTPVKISIIITIFNIILSLILIKYLAHVGIALATSIAGWFHVLCLFTAMRGHALVKDNRALWFKIMKMAFSSMIMGVALYGGYWLFGAVFDGALSLLTEIFYLSAMILVATIIYFLCGFLFAIVSRDDIKQFLRLKNVKKT